MANELVLRLRFEAAQARKEIAEVRAALRGLKNEGGGGGRATAIGSGFTRAGASAQVNAYRVVAAAAKAGAVEIIAGQKQIAAMSHRVAAEAIDNARRGVAEDKRASAAKINNTREVTAEESRAARSRLDGIRQGLSEDKRASAGRLSLVRELSAEDKRASAARLASGREVSQAAINANRQAASSAQAATASTRQQTAELQRQAAALRQARLEQQGATGAVRQHTSALKQAVATGLQLAAVYGTIRAASAAFGAGINYQAKLEGARLAIASVVSANEKIIDAQGKQIEGVEKLKIAQDQVGLVMESLRVTAIKTGTPIQVLVSGFQAAVAPASAMGLSLKQTENVVVGLTNAMKAMNVPLDQQRQEIQDILNADIDRNSHVAKNLQLNSGILNNWKSQGVLAERLLELLKDYNVAAGEFKNTWAGATAIMRGNFEALMGTMTSDSFKTLKDEFKKLSEMFASDEARDQAKLYGRALADGLGAALEVSHAIADVLKSTSDGWMNLLRIVKGPEADIANFKAQTSTFKQLLDESYQSRVSRPNRMGANQLDPGVGAVSSQLSPEARAKIPNPRFEEGFESYQGRLAKVPGLAPQDRQVALQAHARSIVAGQNASNKVLGLEEAYVSTPDSGSRQGVKIVPGGSPGGVSAKVTAEEKENLQYELQLARKKAHGDETQAIRNEIAVYNKAISEVGKTGLDKVDLQRELNLAKEDLVTATIRSAAKDVKANASAVTSSARGETKQDALSVNYVKGEIKRREGGGDAAIVQIVDEFLNKARPGAVSPQAKQAIGDLAAPARRRQDERATKSSIESNLDLFYGPQGQTEFGIPARQENISKQALSGNLSGIGRRLSESVDIAGITSTSPREAFQVELDAKKKAIAEEYQAREEYANSFALSNKVEQAKLLEEAKQTRKEDEEDLRSFERVGRLRIAKEEGEARMAFVEKMAGALGKLGTLGGGISAAGDAVGGLASMAGLAGASTLAAPLALVGGWAQQDDQRTSSLLASAKDADTKSESARRKARVSANLKPQESAVIGAEDALKKAMSDLEDRKKLFLAPTAAEERAVEAAKNNLEGANISFDAAKTNEKAAEDMRAAARTYEESISKMNKDFVSKAADISLKTDYTKLDTARASGKITEEQYLTGKAALDKKAVGADIADQVEGVANSIIPSLGEGDAPKQLVAGAAKEAFAALQGGKSIEDVGDMTTAWGGKMNNVFSGDALKNLAALAGNQGASLESIDANLKAQLEKGTERMPMVIQPPRNSDLAFASRSSLMGQRRQGASRSLAGNVRTIG